MQLHDWEKVQETSIHEKEDFYSSLNKEDITEVDLKHIKNLCKFHDLYVQIDTLLLV